MTSQYKTLGTDEVYIDRVSIRTVSYLDVKYTPNHELELGSTLQLRIELESNLSYWDHILKESQGHPSLFLQMLKLTNNKEIQFHDLESECKFKWVIRKLNINSNHRIETLPENINLNDLAKDLSHLSLPSFNNIKFSLIFNLYNQPRLLNGELFSMEKICWLNMSGPFIKGINFKTVIQAINLGKLKNLKGIVITGINIKKHDLINDICLMKRGKLQYLETDHIIKDPHFDVIDVDKDFRMMGDAGKLNYLCQKGIFEQNEEEILLDYGVCKSWYERGSTAKTTDFHCYKIRRSSPNLANITIDSTNLKKRSTIVGKVKIPSRRRTFLTKSSTTSFK